MQNYNSVDHFNDCMELLQQPVFLLKSRNKVIYAWNRAFIDLVNLPESEIMGKPWTSFLGSDSYLDWGKVMDELQDKGERKNIPGNFLKGNQDAIPSLISFKSIIIKNEGYILVTVIDLSQTSILENQTRKEIIQEQRLRFHFENTPLAIIEWDTDFLITRWSKKAEELFGWNAVETIGVSLQDLNLVFPDDILIMEKTMERLTGGKERTVVSGNRNLTKDGRVIHCIWYNSILNDENGKMISVMSLVDDVSEQKIAEDEQKKYSDLLEERVKIRTVQLTKLKNNLEELVRERTSDLEANNKKLTKEIVERRRAVDALKESERKFREIVQNIPGMVFQLRVGRDGSNHFNYISPHAGNLFNLPFPEISEEWEFTNYIHPDDRAGFIASIAKAISNHTQWNFEGRILTLNDELKWFQGISSPAVIGQDLVFDGLMLDITEQKYAQEALVKSEHHFRTLFSSMTEGLQVCEIIFDENEKAINWKFIDVNPAWYAQTGITFDVTGKMVMDLNPGLEPSWLERYGNVVKTGISDRFDNFNAFTQRYYSIYAYKLHKNTCAVIVQDITQARKEERELNISLTKYKVLFDSFPLGITISDQEGKMIEINKKAEEILELRPIESTDRSIRDKAWNIIRTDGSIMPTQEFASVRALESNMLVSNIEMGLVGEKGHIKWLNVTAAPIPLDGYGVAITYNDITDKIKSREIIEDSERSYRTLFNAMTEGFAVHEIICDEKGKPVDYRLLDCNPAFEKITGLKKADVIGKKVSEFLPNVEPEWINIYGEVALTGKPAKFEMYASDLRRYYQVFAYSPATYRFAAVFMDVTERKIKQNSKSRNEYIHK